MLRQTASNNVRSFISSLLTVRVIQKIGRLLAREGDPTHLVREYMSVTEHEYAIYQKGAPRSCSHFADHYDFDLALYPDSKSAKTKVTLLKGVMKRAKELADSKGVRLVVVIQPSSRDLTTNQEVNYKMFSAYRHYKQTNLTDAAEKVLREQRIPYVNLFNLFAEHQPENLFFRGDDDHWTDTGQRIAAQAVAEYIMREYLVTGIEVVSQWDKQKGAGALRRSPQGP